MKSKSLRKYLIISAFLLFVYTVKAETSDSLLIINCALNYAGGWFNGNAQQMEQAIHPDLDKVIPIQSNSGIYLKYSSYSWLIEGSRAKRGILDEDKRKLKVNILNINDDVANVKINSAKFNDYLQMIKIDGQWKIINVLWNYGLDSPKRVQGFNPNNEYDEILKTANNYIEGIMSGDTKLFEISVTPEYSRLSYNKLEQTGTIAIFRKKYGAIMAEGMAKTGVISETKRQYNLKVLDVMDAMAVLEITTPKFNEYLQMYKDGNTWKVFHGLIKNNLDYSFNENLPAIIDHQMPDFTLPVFQGGEFTLSNLKGKNVLIVFPRGWIGNHWCQVCQYQYLELLNLAKDKDFQMKYNLEVFFILPYSEEKIADWVEKLPDAKHDSSQGFCPDWVERLQEGVNKINEWKNYQNSSREFADFITEYYPDINVDANKLEIPILMDEDKKVSKRLQLFTNFWDGITSEQNIPTVFIIDKNGIIKFKYHSQTTFDRPNAEYLTSILEKLNAN